MHFIFKSILVIFAVIAILSVIRTGLAFVRNQYLSDLGVDYPSIEDIIPEDQSLESDTGQLDLENLIGDGNSLDISNITDFIKSRQEPGDGSYKDFTSSDGVLEVKYPSGWLVVEGGNLENVSQAREESYGSKVLFLATALEIDQFKQLIVEERKGEEGSFKEIIAQMEEINLEEGWAMEIIDKEVDDNVMLFEAKYRKEERLPTYSKEKIVLYEKEGKTSLYSVSFITFYKNWSESEEQADFILDSFKINE